MSGPEAPSQKNVWSKAVDAVEEGRGNRTSERLGSLWGQQAGIQDLSDRLRAVRSNPSLEESVHYSVYSHGANRQVYYFSPEGEKVLLRLTIEHMKTLPAKHQYHKLRRAVAADMLEKYLATLS